ncbi:hypothetical protein H4R20_001792, partial [Coemansia guatemalensis]
MTRTECAVTTISNKVTVLLLKAMAALLKEEGMVGLSHMVVLKDSVDLKAMEIHLPTDMVGLPHHRSMAGPTPKFLSSIRTTAVQ